MIKKTVTAKKLAANRNNSLNSTGPKSDRGKAHSRMNAIKHGILATTLLVIEDEEDVAAFRKVLYRVTRGLAPEGALEELWVAKIAMCWWRQKLALTCELDLAPTAFGAEDQERHGFVVGCPIRSGSPLRTIQRELLYCLDQLQKLQRSRKRTGQAIPTDIHSPEVL